MTRDTRTPEEAGTKPKTALGQALRLLDLAVWGFAGEPRRCSRCGCDEGDKHSPTCPMPAEVLEPLRVLLDAPQSRDARWESYIDECVERIRKAAVG